VTEARRKKFLGVWGNAPLAQNPGYVPGTIPLLYTHCPNTHHRNTHQPISHALVGIPVVGIEVILLEKDPLYPPPLYPPLINVIQHQFPCYTVTPTVDWLVSSQSHGIACCLLAE